MSGRCLWSIVWNNTSSKLRRSNISPHSEHCAKCFFSSVGSCDRPVEFQYCPRAWLSRQPRRMGAPDGSSCEAVNDCSMSIAFTWNTGSTPEASRTSQPTVGPNLKLQSACDRIDTRDRLARCHIIISTHFRFLRELDFTFILRREAVDGLPSLVSHRLELFVRESNRMSARSRSNAAVRSRIILIPTKSSPQTVRSASMRRKVRIASPSK